MRSSLHCLRGREAEHLEHDANAMQPIMPAGSFPGVAALYRPQPLGITAQLRKNGAYVGRIERDVNHGFRPIKLSFEFLGLWRLADHDRPCGAPS